MSAEAEDWVLAWNAHGALLLESAQQLLAVPLEVARGGLREGVAQRLLADAAVAA